MLLHVPYIGDSYCICCSMCIMSVSTYLIHTILSATKGVLCSRGIQHKSSPIDVDVAVSKVLLLALVRLGACESPRLVMKEMPMYSSSISRGILGEPSPLDPAMGMANPSLPSPSSSITLLKFYGIERRRSTGRRRC
jgi:hypothetical protein